MLINNHEQVANRGEIKGQLALEHIFGFCQTFKKVTKIFGLLLSFRTNDLQSIFYTNLAGNIDIKVTFNSFYLFVPIYTPASEPQVIFNESNKNPYRVPVDSWYTEGKLANGGKEFQFDIRRAQNVKSPKYIIAAHQPDDGISVPNKRRNIAFFDNLTAKKLFC